MNIFRTLNVWSKSVSQSVSGSVERARPRVSLTDSVTHWLTLAAIAFTLSCAPPAQGALNGWARLNAQEQALYGYNWIGVFDATNFSASVTNAANAAANTLFPQPLVGTVNFPAGTRIRNVGVRVVKAVSTSDGSASFALNIGDCVVTNRFASALSVGTNVGTGTLTTNADGLWGFNAGAAGGSASTWYTLGNTNFMYNTATNISLWLLGPSLNSTINNGRFEIYLDAVDLNDARGR